MKLTINTFEGYANTPQFVIDYGKLEFDEPLIIPVGDCGCGRAWYLAYNYDLSIMNYRSLQKARSAGNTNFGYPEAGYESGWSSRASCVNKEFGFKYVDVGNYAIELDKLLYLLGSKYVGRVYLAKRDVHTDLEYVVEPYVKDMAYKYDTDREHLILDTMEPGFVDTAIKFLTGEIDLYERAVRAEPIMLEPYGN